MKKGTHAADLAHALWPEVFQTEESARSHPAREAKRLRATPPADAMRAVSRHATESLTRLHALAERRSEKSAKGGSAVGQLLSLVRTFGTDLLISNEKSYRGTLLGIQHGLGVFALLEDVAIAGGDQELADFCASWLQHRRQLVVAVEEELAWFAQNPGVAMSRLRPASNDTLQPVTSP